jgi:hypothetical protein
MAPTLVFETMTTADKLRLLKNPWQNGSAGNSAADSSSWHGDVLARRDRSIDSGAKQFIERAVAEYQPGAESLI